MNRHKWEIHPIKKQSKYNRICMKCDCEKIVSPFNYRNIEYKINNKTFYKTPKCNK